mmetsp:Transcript_18214/g.61901  ORF Transcript_18214/g.61901 Transcript_18214/m.61901 type:complete len:113 (-) Transcript_18214:257-595(-)
MPPASAPHKLCTHTGMTCPMSLQFTADGRDTSTFRVFAAGTFDTFPDFSSVLISVALALADRYVDEVAADKPAETNTRLRRNSLPTLRKIHTWERFALQLAICMTRRNVQPI